jgi:hypothetical protein
MNSPDSAAQQKASLDELASLSRQQSRALQDSVFIQMTREQMDEYDLQGKRISELCGLVRDFKPK